MLVFKLSKYRDFPIVGLVVNETSKLYQVKERSIFSDEWERYLQNWKKSECFTKEEDVSKALIKKAEKSLEWSIKEVSNYKTRLEKARGWKNTIKES